MTIALDASTTSSVISNTTSSSFSHTVGTSQLPVVLFVLVSLRGAAATGTNPSSVSVTYNGVSMTLAVSVAETTTRLCTQIYYLAFPATGSNTVAVSWTGASYGYAVSRSYYGVSTGSPVYGTGTLSPTLSAPSINVSSIGGDVVLDCLALERDFTETLTVDASQTQIINNIIASQVVCAMSTETASTSGNVTMSWTKSGAADYVAGVVCSIRAASQGSAAAVSPALIF